MSNNPDNFGINSFLMATCRLDRFFFVGAVELFDPSIALLQRKLGTVGVPFRVDRVPNENQTKVLQLELGWLCEDDDVGRDVLGCNLNDRRLYERYRRRLESDLDPEKGGSAGGRSDIEVDSQGHGSARITEAEISRALSEFSSWEYRRLNARRLEHLASLGLGLANKSVWEVSAGTGDLTSFFLDRDCAVHITEARPVLLEILRDRFPKTKISDLDLENPNPGFSELFEVVFCYSTLCHVSNPDQAIAFLASRCDELLILETRVARGNGLAVNRLEEDRSWLTQSVHGIGCRPTRRFIFEELRKHFPFVYLTRHQPWHDQFPIDWTAELGAKASERSVFIASRLELDSTELVQEIPERQCRQP
jgi:hypothetical protein